MKNKLILWCVFLFGAFCVIAGVIASLMGHPANGTVVIVTGLALIILSQFEIETLKIFGLEAKLRNTLSEAEQILEKLKGISIPISKLSVSTAMTSGRLGAGATDKEMYDYILELEAQLRGIGATPENIKAVKGKWITFSAFDQISKIIEHPANTIHEKYKLKTKETQEKARIDPDFNIEEGMKEARNIFSEWESLNVLRRIPDIHKFPSTIKSFMDSALYLTEEEKNKFWEENSENIEDVRFLLDKGEVRRPDLLAS